MLEEGRRAAVQRRRGGRTGGQERKSTCGQKGKLQAAVGAVLVWASARRVLYGGGGWGGEVGIGQKGRK